MGNKLDRLRAGISLFISGCMASSIYLWYLQHPVYISKVRIALGFLIWVGLAPLIYLLGVKVISGWQQLSKISRLFLIIVCLFVSFGIEGSSIGLINLPVNRLALPTHKISIVAMGDKNPASSGSRVELIMLRLNGMDLSFEQLIKVGDWKQDKRGLFAEGGVSINWVGKTTGVFEAVLLMQPAGGKIVWQVDGDEQIVDLYAPQEKEIALKYEFIKPRWNRLWALVFTSISLGAVLFICLLQAKLFYNVIWETKSKKILLNLKNTTESFQAYIKNKADSFRAIFKKMGRIWLRKVLCAFGVIVALLCMAYMAAYLLQDGFINLKERTFFDGVFYDMWLRLTKLDVTSDPTVIGAEAFIINGKTITYFLPLPALARGVLSLFNLGASSVLSMLISYLLFVVFSGKTFLLMIKIALPGVRINPVKKVSWLIFITLASPFLSILVNPSAYWESIAWATAMYMVCLYLSITLLFQPKNIYNLIFFGVACGLTLFTKATTTVSACLVFLLTILTLFRNLVNSCNREEKPKNCVYKKFELIGVSIIFCLFGTLLGALNYARWGNIFEFAPASNHIQYIKGSEREKNFEKYGAFQIDRIPENLSYYFFPSKDNFSSESPFIQAGSSNYFLGFAKNFDNREQTLPIPIILPVFSLFALTGFIKFVNNLIILFKKCGNLILLSSLLPAVISACFSGILLLPFCGQCMRYRNEFIPGIVIFSFYAIAIILKRSYSVNLQKQNKRRAAGVFHYLCIGILLFVSLYSTTAGLLTEKQIFPVFASSSTRIVERFPLLFSKIYDKIPAPVIINDSYTIFLVDNQIQMHTLCGVWR